MKACPNIRLLDLEGCKSLQRASITKAVTGLKNLQILNLHSCMIDLSSLLKACGSTLTTLSYIFFRLLSQSVFDLVANSLLSFLIKHRVVSSPRIQNPEEIRELQAFEINIDVCPRLFRTHDAIFHCRRSKS
jgi:hypothetical protein